MQYPETKKDDTKNIYFGVSVSDPYRWLENSESEPSKTWIKEQIKLTKEYLEKVPFASQIKNRLTELSNFEKSSSPLIKKRTLIYLKKEAFRDQPVLYKKDLTTDITEVFIDPNNEFKKHESLTEYNLSNDGRYLAYGISIGGSDWREIRIRDTISHIDLDDHIINVKFSNISWYKDGFFYSRYKSNSDDARLSSKSLYHQVFYHRVNSDQADDQLIFDQPEYPERIFYTKVSEDETILSIEIKQSSSNNALIIKSLNEHSEFNWVVDNFQFDYDIAGAKNNSLFVLTNASAPNYKLLKSDEGHPTLENSMEIIPESDNLLENVIITKNYIIANYLVDASNQLDVFDHNGAFVKTVNTPPMGSITDFKCDFNNDQIYFSYSSFVLSPAIYQYNAKTDTLSMYFESTVNINHKDYIVKQEFYTSKDGVRIPMFIVHHKNIELNGRNPAMLYGYGGFNISVKPDFDSQRLYWLENGGIYASANLRGGGEYGTTWHESGKLLKKQNVFDDYIKAAEYLIEKKYTSTELMAGVGRSNGGLLIGAVTNQRPDLFKVMIPIVGVMDMLRFSKFTIGWAWTGDYGNIENEREFHNLYKFSPLHNIEKNKGYPAIMAMTADHDDRVVPAHSYKYIAKMQSINKGINPVLIRIEKNAGHAGGTAIENAICEKTDMYSFIYKNLDIKP